MNQIEKFTMKPFSMYCKHATLLIVFMFALLQSLQSTTYTFTGSGNWNDSGLWSPSVPPEPLLATDIIDISGDCALNVTITINGTLNITGNLVLNSNMLGNGQIINNGTMNVNGNVTINYLLDNRNTVNIYNTLTNNATIDNQSGGTVNIYNLLENNAYLWNRGNLNNNGTLSNAAPGGILQNDGILNNDNLFVNTGGTLNLVGTLKGNGTFLIVPNSIFNNLGITAPGTGVGKLTVTGNYFEVGHYNCEINGTGQGTTHDWLAISGTVNLSNAILVVDWGSFLPTAGDEFTILTCGGRDGQFNFMTIPNVSGLQFNVIYSATSVKIAALALPVEMTRFSGIEKSGTVLLQWNTATEQNNEGFEIWHSGDGNAWSILGFVKGQGTTTTAQQYFFQDTGPLSGVNYYRLRQVDHDGTTAFSNTITVRLKQEPTISLYPNPVHSYLYAENFPEQAAYSIKNVAGQTLQSGTLLPGMAIDVQNIATGLYYLYFDRQVLQFVKD